MPTQQLTFEGLVNSSVTLEDEVRLSKQNLLVFKRLMQGTATNVELMDYSKSKNITARISDVRDEVENFGWNLERIENLGDGVNLYALITPDGRIKK